MIRRSADDRTTDQLRVVLGFSEGRGALASLSAPRRWILDARRGVGAPLTFDAADDALSLTWPGRDAP
jgi:hypothetical protein